MSERVIPINTAKTRDDLVIEPPARSDAALEPQYEGGDREPGFLAVDLGLSRISAGIVSDDGNVMVRDRVSTPQRSVWPVVTQLVRRVMAANRTGVRPVRCGVTAPGPIDRLTGAIKPAGLPMWHDFPVQRELARLTGMPVSVDTHGRALARAEQWMGEIASTRPEDQYVVTLMLGEEVDGAVIAGGTLLEGLTENLGQFGHLVVEPGGFDCPCGAAGCLTAYAGARGIEASIGRDLQRTPPAIVERTGIMVARACASIAAALDPHEIVLGGVVPTVLGQPFYDAVERELSERSRLPHLRAISVRHAAGPVGPLLAAASLAHHAGIAAVRSTDGEPVT